jgi:small subunit ribosomal protein S6
MRLSEDVIRYLTVKQSGPMPAPRTLTVESAELAAPSPATAAASAE